MIFFTNEKQLHLKKIYVFAMGVYGYYFLKLGLKELKLFNSGYCFDTLKYTKKKLKLYMCVKNNYYHFVLNNVNLRKKRI